MGIPLKDTPYISREETKLENKKSIESENKKRKIVEQAKKKQNSESKIWEIKTKYTGGDRVLEFCLDGLGGQKKNYLNIYFHVQNPKKNLKKQL